MKKYASLTLMVVFSVAMFTGLIPADVCFAKSMILTDAENTVDPVSGQEITVRKFNTSYDGVKYWFASYDSLKKFKADPARYAGKVTVPVKKSMSTSKKTTTTKTTTATTTTTKPTSTQKEQPKKWYPW